MENQKNLGCLASTGFIFWLEGNLKSARCHCSSFWREHNLRATLDIAFERGFTFLETMRVHPSITIRYKQKHFNFYFMRINPLQIIQLLARKKIKNCMFSLAGADFVFLCKHCNYSWIASWIALLSSHRLISLGLHLGKNDTAGRIHAWQSNRVTFGQSLKCGHSIDHQQSMLFVIHQPSYSLWFFQRYIYQRCLTYGTKDCDCYSFRCRYSAFGWRPFPRATIVSLCVQIKPILRLWTRGFCKSPSRRGFPNFEFLLPQIHDSVRISCCGQPLDFFNVILHFCTNCL